MSSHSVGYDGLTILFFLPHYIKVVLNKDLCLINTIGNLLYNALNMTYIKTKLVIYEGDKINRIKIKDKPLNLHLFLLFSLALLVCLSKNENFIIKRTLIVEQRKTQFLSWPEP